MSAGGLFDQAAFADPVAALRRDRATARDQGDPNAELCWLATADARGAPTVRTLVLRDLDEGFALFVNATSTKAEALAERPRCQLAVWLSSCQRQWRLDAAVRPLDPDVLRRHWQRRPRTAQVMDHLYEVVQPQSSVLDSPAALAEHHRTLDAALDDAPSPPASARGLVLDLEAVECLQIRAGDQLHERARWEKAGRGWRRVHLVP